MHTGKIVRVSGPVVDCAGFDGALPKIKEALPVTVGGEVRTMEVAAHIGDGTVRCVLLAGSENLALGMPVTATGSGIRVPVGTIVRLAESGDLLADIDEPGKEVVVAKGGAGGRGNARFATSVNQAPREHEPGQKVDPVDVELELKIVADIGFVGYPNAGKSTLLSDLTNANPKIGPYPFTTLNPVVGIMEYEDFKKITVADIPGLVDGAHRNVGLGHEFLRHIERTRMLVYVLDMGGTDGRNPIDDLHALQRELDLYSDGLSARAKLIIANKMDMEESEKNLEDLLKDLNKTIPVFPMSAVLDPDFNEIKDVLRDLLSKCPEHTALETEQA